MAQVTEAEDFLAHFGVVGMKWGKHKASTSSGSSAPSRKELRAKDKVARAEDRVTRKETRTKAIDDIHKEIGAARKALPKAQIDYNNAKLKYKEDKRQIGKVAARRALAVHGDKLVDTLNKATAFTSDEAKKYNWTLALGGDTSAAVYNARRIAAIRNGQANLD